MSWDGKPIFCYSTVSVAPAPALTGLSLSVNAGDGALFGATFPFECVVWPTALMSLKTNAEILTVTARVGDVLTIGARATQGSTARAIIVGDQIIASITPKVFSDLEAAIDLLGYTAVVPASSAAAGIRGQWTFSGGYMYRAIALNTWRRWPASTF